MDWDNYTIMLVVLPIILMCFFIIGTGLIDFVSLVFRQ